MENENLPDTLKPKTPASVGRSLFLDSNRFEFAQRVAMMLSKSTMVPEHFRNNIGNCVIALNLAERFMADPFMVMQNVYVVHGKPGLEGKLVIALINQCGKFTPLQFKFEKVNGKVTSCTAYATHKETKETLEQTVTWEMVQAEGWDKKNGSKWLSLRNLMFQYRAATFFARVYCPEVILGMQTIEEILDFVDMTKQENGSYDVKEKTEAKLNDLKERLKTEPETTDNQEFTTAVKLNLKPDYKCDICGYEAASERGMKTHMTRSHAGKEVNAEWPDEDELKAEAEAAAKKKAEELNQKVNGSRNGETGSQSSDSGSQSSDSGSQEDLYTCGECKQQMTAEELNVHQCPGPQSDQTQKLIKDLVRRIKEFDSEVKDEAFKQAGLQGSAELERYDVRTLDEILELCFVVQKDFQM